jgi:Putative adhesin
MLFRRDVLLLAVMMGLLSGCDIDEIASFGNAHAFEKEFHQSYPLKSGGRLSLEGFNGSVEIRGWDQDKVEIDGVQYGSTERLRDAIQIDVVASGDSVQIRTTRPAERFGNAGVTFVIKAPRKVNLDRIVTSNASLRLDDVEGVMRVRTSNGAVRASKLRGELEVQTSNGSVEVSDLEGPAVLRTTNGRVHADEIRGALEASTTNGAIEARLHQPEAHRPVRLSTSNGSIELTMDSLDDNNVRATTHNGGITVKLPSGAGARVHASTSHSAIRSDFDVDREESHDKNRLDGRIGAGGPTLELSTSNGSIRLLKL